MFYDLLYPYFVPIQRGIGTLKDYLYGKPKPAPHPVFVNVKPEDFEDQEEYNKYVCFLRDLMERPCGMMVDTGCVVRVDKAEDLMKCDDSKEE